MAASRFFVMYRDAHNLHIQDLLQRVDIAAIPMCTLDYYEGIRARYASQLITKGPVGPPKARKEPDNNFAKDRLFELLAFKRDLGGI